MTSVDLGMLRSSNARAWVGLCICPAPIGHRHPPETQSLLRPQATAEIVNMIAGRPPSSAGRPVHPKGLVSFGRFAERPSRPAAGVSLSESGVH